jgi:hypothetical protein
LGNARYVAQQLVAVRILLNIQESMLVPALPAWAVRFLRGSVSRNFAAADRHTYAWWHPRQDQDKPYTLSGVRYKSRTTV